MAGGFSDGYFDGCDTRTFKGAELPPWFCPRFIAFYYNPRAIDDVLNLSLRYQAPVVNLLHAPPPPDWSASRRKNLTQFGHAAFATSGELGAAFGIDPLPEDRAAFLAYCGNIEFYPLRVA